MPRSHDADHPDDSIAAGVQVATGEAELLPDIDRPGGFLLLVDRVRQSYVDLNDPTYLDLEYVQHFADIVHTLPAGPLAVTHIGGGAFSFPRYLAAVRPGSPQIVLEPDQLLTDYVRSRLPFAREARIRVRAQGGREGVAALKDASADLVVLDAFVGARIPAELTTAQFVAELARVVAEPGMLLANLADGPPLRYLSRVLATVREQFPELAIVADPAVLKGRRFGNVVLVASRAGVDYQGIERAAAAAMFPLAVRRGRELAKMIGAARPFTDAESMRSPAPPDGSWRAEFD